MRFFIKFIASIFALPFLLPWYLADKAFEYFYQPILFKKYGLEVSRVKIVVNKSLRILFLVSGLFYIIFKAYQWYALSGSMAVMMSSISTFFILIYNDFAHLLNFLLTPVNRLIYSIQGGTLPLTELLTTLFFFTAGLTFCFSFIYRLVSTKVMIRRAEGLRNSAVRDVDIVHFSEKARDNEIFVGLDISRDGRPFYVNNKVLGGHLQVVGGPGSGKTESLVQPIWYQKVRRNVATFVIDGKASRRNVDKFFTIASSLAQGEDILYFNPTDLSRSDTYNPLLRGSVTDVKQKILASINWVGSHANQREQLDLALDLFLSAMEETRTHFNLRELDRYFSSEQHVREQMERVADAFTRGGLEKILTDFSGFQDSVAFFRRLLRNLFNTEYGQLLNAKYPTIDIIDAYLCHRDCYFTLPMQTDETTSRFVGQLIQQDLIYSFRQIALNNSVYTSEEGLVIIDELSKFVNDDFLKLLQASSNAGVSVCYTNQSLVELSNPALNLSPSFVAELANNTNAICCFQLGSQAEVETMLKRFGYLDSSMDEDEESYKQNFKKQIASLRQLEVGRCVFFARRPEILTILKTGYFKFDRLLTFSGKRKELAEMSY